MAPARSGSRREGRSTRRRSCVPQVVRAAARERRADPKSGGSVPSAATWAGGGEGVPAREDLLERSRRGVEAEALLREALARRPESGEGHFRLGQLLQRKGDLPDAEAHYRVAVERNPKVPAALGNLARVLAAQDKFREAVQFCAKACELLQNQATPHVELGAMLEKIGRKHDAERAYRHALKLAPETQPALLRLARLLVAEPSAREEAAGLFERFLDQKDDPGIRLSLAELYAHIENPQAARDHAQKALNDADEAGNDRIRDRAAALLASL